MPLQHLRPPSNIAKPSSRKTDSKYPEAHPGNTTNSGMPETVSFIPKNTIIRKRAALFGHLKNVKSIPFIGNLSNLFSFARFYCFYSSLTFP
jgi:hypothetical protein